MQTRQVPTVSSPWPERGLPPASPMAAFGGKGLLPVSGGMKAPGRPAPMSMRHTPAVWGS
jgi:hypothetical protein